MGQPVTSPDDCITPNKKTATTGVRSVILRIALAVSLWPAGCARQRQAVLARNEESDRLAQQARSAQDRGDSDTAEKLFTEAVNNNPRNCETRLELSELLLQTGSTDAAVMQLRRLVAQNPDEPRGYVRLAQTLYLQEQYDEAEKMIDVALKMDPQHTDGLILRAQLDEIRGKDDRALEVYHRAMLADAKQVQAQLHLAELYLKRGRARQAAPLLRFVLDNPHACPAEQSDAWWLLGKAYASEERWRDAAQALDAGIEGRRMTADDWYRVAFTRHRSGDTPGALHAVEELLRLAPGDPEGRLLYAALQAGPSDANDALPVIRAAGELPSVDPSSPPAHHSALPVGPRPLP
jgi:tetratricopeptide (TPR) repeat protein